MVKYLERITSRLLRLCPLLILKYLGYVQFNNNDIITVNNDNYLAIRDKLTSRHYFVGGKFKCIANKIRLHMNGLKNTVLIARDSDIFIDSMHGGRIICTGNSNIVIRLLVKGDVIVYDNSQLTVHYDYRK